LATVGGTGVPGPGRELVIQAQLPGQRPGDVLVVTDGGQFGEGDRHGIVGEVAREFLAQTGLAHPARPLDRHQAGGPQEASQLVQVVVPAQQGGQGPAKPSPGESRFLGGGGLGRVGFGRMGLGIGAAQQVGVVVVQRGARVGPQVLGQAGGVPRVDVERLRRPPGLVQGTHQVAGRGVVVGMRGAEGLEFSDRRGGAARVERGVGVDGPELVSNLVGPCGQGADEVWIRGPGAHFSGPQG
jgi:hypothetical protein